MTQFKQTNTGERVVYKPLSENGFELDLNGATAEFYMMKNGQTYVNAPAYVENQSLVYDFTEQDTLYPGVYAGEFKVVYQDGTVKHYPEKGFLSIKIDKILNPDASTVGEERVALQVSLVEDFKAEVNAKLVGVEDATLAANDAATHATTQGDYAKAEADRLVGTDVSVLDNRVTQLDAQLAEIATLVTKFGAVADANYYDTVNKKYYSDATMTIPATDNQKAFQDAVDYLANNGGGTLFVPKGTYMFKNSVKWKSKVSMIGSGIGDTKFVVEGTIFSLFYNTDGAANGSSGTDPNVWLENCRFENFDIDLIGLTSTDVSVGGKGFFILYMKRARFRNLYLRNTIGTALGCDFLVDTVIDNIVVENAGRNLAEGQGGGGQSGIGIGSCAVENEPVIVSNCHIYNCGNYGIFVETQNNPSGVKSQHAQIINNYCYGNRSGIGNKGSGGVLISGNSIINSDTSGIHLSESAGNDVITNNRIVKNKVDGIYIGTGYKGDLIVFNNFISENGGRGILFLQTTISESKNFKVANNMICDNNYSGIDLQGGQKNTTITDNTLKNNGKTVSSTYAAGINMQSFNGIGQTNLMIRGNSFFDDQATRTQISGVKTQVASNLTDAIISENHVVGYTYNLGINIASGTKTNVKVKRNTGYITEQNGNGTIPDAATYVDITFPESMAGVPTTINLTSGTSEHVWYSNVTRSGMRVNRSGSTGVLNFSWRAEI